MDEIVYTSGPPKKNIFILALLHMRFPVLLPFVKWIIKKHLKNAKNIDFVPGFRYLYGNIYARNAHLCDTFFVDYAPIYIGEGSWFSFENILLTSTHDFDNPHIIKAKPIYIGKNVWVTSRCVILGGITIGDNSVVAAGSVVTKNVPSNSLVAGNPAKVIKKL